MWGSLCGGPPGGAGAASPCGRRALLPRAARARLHVRAREVAEARLGAARAEHGERVAQVVDVAERVGAARVAHEAQERLRELTRDLGRHGEVLVLLLPQPRARVGQVQPLARRLRAVRAGAVVDRAGVEEDGARLHLRGLALRLREAEPVAEALAPRHDAGGAVRLGERVDCPERVALHLVAAWEREEVEG